MNKTPQSNPLAADIEDEYHTHLLEKGNLNRPKRFTDWNEKPKPIFEAVGYVVELNRFKCRCGNEYTHLEGIYVREKLVNAPGGQRFTRVDSRGFQPVPTFPVEYNTVQNTIPLCPACLPFN